MSLISLDLSINLSKRSIESIKKTLAKEVSQEIFAKLKNEKVFIKDQVKKTIHKNLMNSPEVRSIIDDNGKLRVELGLKNGEQDIFELIADISDKTDLSITQSFSASFIDIKIELFIDGQYSDFYSKHYSSYLTKSGIRIEWLEWLLEAGNRDVVFGYKIRYGVNIGRTGEAIMLPNRSANWRVPPEFSGVSTDNFITRAFEGVDKQLESIIGSIL